MRLLLLAALLASSSGATGDLYIWTDAKGVTHMGSDPPDQTEQPPAQPKGRKKKKKPTVQVFKGEPEFRHEYAQGTLASSPTVGPADASGKSPDGQPAAKPAPSVELYTTSWCHVCKEARSYLSGRGIAYRDYDVENDPSAYARYQGYGGHGVPLGVINGTVISGFSPASYDQLLPR